MAAINKAFVIKNGLEVNSGLIFADALNDKVGIGTTSPQYDLHVIGGIGVTNSFVSGISTTGILNVSNVLSVGNAGTVITTTVVGSVGLGTTNPQYKLHVIGDIGFTNLTGTAGTITIFNSVNGTIINLTGTNLSVAGIGTLGSLSIGSTQVISSAKQLQNIASLDATTTATIEAAIANAPNTFTDLRVTGISTLGTVKVSSGIISATSGIVTYFGDGSNLTGIATGLTATIGISSGGAVIGTGVTTVNVVGIGFTADASGTTANLYLPAPGVSLGLAIALGG